MLVAGTSLYKCSQLLSLAIEQHNKITVHTREEITREALGSIPNLVKPSKAVCLLLCKYQDA